MNIKYIAHLFLFVSFLNISCKQSSNCPDKLPVFNLPLSSLQTTPYFNNKNFDTLTFVNNYLDTIVFVKNRIDSNLVPTKSNVTCGPTELDQEITIHYTTIKGTGEFWVWYHYFKDNCHEVNFNNIRFTFNELYFKDPYFIFKEITLDSIKFSNVYWGKYKPNNKFSCLYNDTMGLNFVCDSNTMIRWHLINQK